MTPKDEIHILQFGTGNFLRAFFEPMVQDLNEKNNPLNICIIQSTSGKTLEKLQSQNFQYHVLEAGIKNGAQIEKIRKITCIKSGLTLPFDKEKFLALAQNPHLKWIISNVTEAGMVWKSEGDFEQFAESFPGRLTQWLFHRYRYLPNQETILLPCELLADNGSLLKDFVLRHAKNWDLGEEFIHWVEEKTYFFSSLVDRIVPGFPSHLDLKEKESDELVVQTEPYSFWAIEGTPSQKSMIPFLESEAEVILEEDISAYSLRKIRILNGCHTYLAARGAVLGFETVGECMKDQETLAALEELVAHEMIPFLPLDPKSLELYKEQVFDRFRNPFVQHKLADIRLNSVAKFKSRLLPLIPPFLEKSNGTYPIHISKGMISLVLFYLNHPDKIRDTQEIIDFFAKVPLELNQQDKVSFVAKNLFNLDWNTHLASIYEGVLEEINPS